MEVQRWHDADPVVALAVDLMKKAGRKVQNFCADFIIEQIRNAGYELQRKTIIERFNCFWRRWQDDDEKMFEAMEYLRLADEGLKKEVSLGVIDYIRQLEGDKN